MRGRACWALGAVIAAGLVPVACGGSDASSEGKPATLERVVGADGLYRVTLTARAAERIGIETAEVGAGVEARRAQRVVPFSAVIYQPDGGTWTYTSPEPLVYLRQAITVETVDEGLAFLSEGPPTGTVVVTVGAAELLGVESGIGGK